MCEILAPHVGDDEVELYLVEWHKSVGDSIEVGEAIAEVMTDKANMDVMSQCRGSVVELCFAVDERFGSGEVIARVEP